MRSLGGAGGSSPCSCHRAECWGRWIRPRGRRRRGHWAPTSNTRRGHSRAVPPSRLRRTPPRLPHSVRSSGERQNRSPADGTVTSRGSGVAGFNPDPRGRTPLWGRCLVPSPREAPKEPSVGGGGSGPACWGVPGGHPPAVIRGRRRRGHWAPTSNTRRGHSRAVPPSRLRRTPPRLPHSVRSRGERQTAARPRVGSGSCLVTCALSPVPCHLCLVTRHLTCPPS
jgi:hypothetical protein